ncbi:aromatic ring-hydroxylating dioxygenase subunit alpha [Sporichthya sp.]|uniref:aromatic ring-hydroxylating oxygenase subunit alpha n=1 Tax=Sporichthya sp. TaxID=65475 RepID=UPI00179ADF82|nr:aromatic ring-hydroxylating dioxygenase subunit alpha [Sporichthya sp.]MBA3744350.1 aromatic ring-hydroxylating dioxygenase subunit alpha [Sporichthya sp.]
MTQVSPDTSPETGPELAHDREGAVLTPEERQYPLAPSSLDIRVYSDPDRYRRELQEIFYKTWFPVMPAEDLLREHVQVWEGVEQSVVLSRLADGRVCAWHNVCQHRGAKIVRESGPCPTGRVRCPWHGFGYDLEGVVNTVPLKDSFDAAELVGLRAPAVRVQEWSGFIWICFSDTTPDLLPYLGEVGAELSGYGLDEFRTVYRTEVVLNANWKVVLDGFNETWHVPFTHQDSLGSIVRWREAVLRVPSPHSWMTIPIRGFTERVESEDHRQTHLCHYLTFPNTIFSCFPTHLQMWSAWPLAVDKTRLIAHHVVGPTPDGQTDEQWMKRNLRDWEHFVTVLGEDSEVLDDFGQLVNSLGFRRNMFNTAESRLTAFHHEVAVRLGEDQ